MVLKPQNRIWVLGGLALIFQVALLLIISRVMAPLDYFRFQTSLSPELVGAILGVLPAHEKALLAQHYWLDFIYPFVYAMFLRECLLRLRMPFLFLPFVAGGLDLVENFVQLPMLLGWIQVSSPLFYVAAFCSVCKFGLLVAVFVLLARGVSLRKRL